MLELPGQPALSDFRVAKLTRALKRVDDRVESLQASYVYFAATNRDLSRDERSRLDSLLRVRIEYLQLILRLRHTCAIG